MLEIIFTAFERKLNEIDTNITDIPKSKGEEIRLRRK